MRHFSISSSSFEALGRDLMKIATFESMIRREIEAKSQNLEAPLTLINLNFRTIEGKEQTCFKKFVSLAKGSHFLHH